MTLTDAILTGLLVAVGSLVAGWTAAYVIVEAADRLGLCYSSEREAHAHRNDPLPRFHA